MNQNKKKVVKKNEERKKDGEPSLPMKEYRPTIPYPIKLKENYMDE